MTRERVLREALAVGLLLGAVLLAVALGSHSPLDPSPLHLSTERATPANLAGWLGASVSAAALALVGLPALLLPVLAAAVGWRLLRDRPFAYPRLLALGWGLLMIAVPALVHMVRSDWVARGGTVPGGGMVGRAVAELLLGFAGPVGRLVILAFVLVVGLLLTSGASAAAVAERLVEGLRRRLAARSERRSTRRRERDQAASRRRVLARQLERLETDDEFPGTVTVKEVKGKGRFRIVRKRAAEPQPPQSEATIEKKVTSARRGRKPGTAVPESVAPVVQEEFDFIDDLSSYDLPKVSFLDPAEEPESRDSSALIEMSHLIASKCQEFRVRGEVVNIRTGPVITTYEFRLDSGVKISAVQNLAEDLALALKTESVRIERVPGRATVGIEVPNPNPQVIRLRQIMESPEFQRTPSLLSISLGVDIHGNPAVADLSRMPHLLIGGFTGSGKSVGINAMIMSILYKARPDQVKFILVDPKMVELGVYADIPHLLTPIIVDPKKAANALGWTVSEMEDRYRRLAALGVRNLAQYNQLVADPVQLRRTIDQLRWNEEENGPPTLQPLPYIVVIIDELADLMMTSSRAVEESITRLAQKARAVGIHLVCATQRPSVDILTGIIKANFPCRIAYKVRSKFDSRTILDIMGAEHLLGRGDMLFLAPGTSNLQRMHGPLVTEKEIATVVRYIKRFGKPEYQRDVLAHPALGGDKSGRRTSLDEAEIDELGDSMYEPAARLVVKTRKASASYIQRRLHLGYTRSARLLDMMEREGVVGPLNGSKGRDVLVPPDHFSEVDDTLALNLGDDPEDET